MGDEGDEGWWEGAIEQTVQASRFKYPAFVEARREDGDA